MSDGVLSRFGFGHPSYTTELDEFSVYVIERAFRAAFKDDPEVDRKWEKFFSSLDPYDKNYWGNKKRRFADE